MNEIVFESSVYPGDISISRLTTNRNLMSVKFVSSSSDVPEFLSFVYPSGFDKNRLTFDVANSVSPYFTQDNTNIHVLKFSNSVTNVYQKKSLKKANSTVELVKTTSKPYVLYGSISDDAFIYYGEFSPENISNMVWNDIEFDFLNGELFSFRLVAASSVSGNIYIYPDFNNNIVKVFAVCDQDIEDLSAVITYNEFNNGIEIDPTYIIINKIFDYTVETYTITSTIYATEEAQVTHADLAFSPILDFIAFKNNNNNNVYFDYPINNNYIAIDHATKYAQHNLYNKEHGVIVFDIGVKGCQIFMYPIFNRPSVKNEAAVSDIVSFPFYRLGENEVYINMSFKVTNVYAREMDSGKYYYMPYDTVSKTARFSQYFRTGMYEIYVEYLLPSSIGNKLGVNIDGTAIYDISLPWTNVLEKNQITITQFNDVYNAMLQAQQDIDGEVGVVYAAIDPTVVPILIDTRTVNLGSGVFGNIGQHPYDKVLSPYVIPKFLIYSPAVDEYYRRINFDINYNEDTLQQYIEKRVPYYSELMWLNLIELNREIDCKITYDIVDRYFVVKIDIATDSDLFYYIKNVNEAHKGAFLKSTGSYGSVVIDQFDQKLFVGDQIITKNKRLSFLLTMLSADYNIDGYDELKFDIGLYDRTFNFYGKPTSVTVPLKISGFGRGAYGEGPYAAD